LSGIGHRQLTIKAPPRKETEQKVSEVRGTEGNEGNEAGQSGSGVPGVETDPDQKPQAFVIFVSFC
jgi:hypothetical protein